MRLATFILAATLPALADPTPAELEKSLRKHLVAEHHKLAQRCLNGDLTEEARAEFEAVLRADPNDATAKALLGGGGRSWVLRWDDETHAKFTDYLEVRRILNYEASSRYLELGRAKAKAGDAFGAKAAWRRAVEYDADFAEARAELGDARVEGAGWFPKAEAEKRNAGLLLIGGKWLPAAEVRERRKTWGEAWEVAGPHFVVKSNHSPEAAADALRWAEEMYHALVRETAPVYEPPKDVKPMKIYLFATEADYRAHEKEAHPGRTSAAAIGFYSNEDRAAHFWWRPDEGFAPLSTVVRHECSHEVLDAWIPWTEPCTERPHFWVVEGLARWFETVRVRDGKVLVGDRDALAIQVARRLVKADKALSLASLCEMEQDAMHGHYEEAAACAAFFMMAADGRYREKFLRYCRVVLSGKAMDDSFEEVFGERPAEFETAWREWVRAGEKERK